MSCGLLQTGCGAANTETIDALIAAQETSAADSAATIPEPTVTLPPKTEDDTYDVDLTEMNSNMVYAQVYDMVFGETDFNGQTVRARGVFDYYQDPDTQKEYFAVLISDATACCAQGIEFVLAGDHSYPEDYPERGTEITIHGSFASYEDDTGVYMQLQDAVIEE